MSSSSSDEDFQIAKKKKVVAPKKRNVFQVETVEGESNLKGFVSAFNTILDRTEEPPALALSSESSEQVQKKIDSKKEPAVIVSHESAPSMNCEKEIAFKAAAERGVVKLFKAVAMHRKRVLEKEAEKGIGVTKSGQIRRRRPSSTPPPATKTMTGFLQALKSSKSAFT